VERRLGRWRAGRRSQRPGDGRGRGEGAVRPEDRDAVETALREGARREKGGDTLGAAHCYARADQLGSGEGASNLGVLLFDRGDVTAAEAVREARRVLARLGSTSRPRAVPPPDFDPEASAIDSLLWVAGDPDDERVQRARTFVLAQLAPPLRGELAALIERLDRDELDPAHLRAAWRLGRYLEGRPRVTGDEDTDYTKLVVDTLAGLEADVRSAEPLAWARHAGSAADGAS
jgi:hypothetical protein